MKAIILAAGQGKRMLPLTSTIPKPLLRVGDRAIIDYIFESLPEGIDQVLVVVGYLKKKIEQHLGNRFQGKQIRYVVQNELNGTASALHLCKDFFLPHERFIVFYGDELPTKSDVQACLSHPASWLCYPTEFPKQSGIATVNAEGRITEVVEKPEHPVSNLAAAGIMVMNADIFSYPLVQHSNGEYYLSDSMNAFLKGFPVTAVIGPARPGFNSPDELQKIILWKQEDGV